MEGIVRDAALAVVGGAVGATVVLCSQFMQRRRRRAERRSSAGAGVRDVRPFTHSELPKASRADGAISDAAFARLDYFDRPRSPSAASAPLVEEPIAIPVAQALQMDDQAAAIQMYSTDLESFRQRFRPQIVEADRERLEADPNDAVVHGQADGSYWLVRLADGVGLVFPRANRPFGRGMMHYGAAPALFEIRGFQEGNRYRRTKVHAPARVIENGGVWRRHTPGVIEVLEGEPDE